MSAAARSSPSHLRDQARPGGRLAPLAALRPPSAPAAIATGVAASFVLLTVWWLARNQALPYGDAAFHVATALDFHDAIAAGQWTEPLTWHAGHYPPFTPLVGALGIFLGGRTFASPILAQNLLYVPLLAIACYRTAQRCFGSPAGPLAVAFALGAPMIAEQFHVFMLDAPLTALVAATVWLVVESERFANVRFAAAAGVVAGVGLMSKQAFPLYVTGFIVAVILHDGGWRNRRGLGVFLAISLTLAAPWYLGHVSQLHLFFSDAGELQVPPLAKPPLLSAANAGWYLWALANGLLFTPLLAFAAIGVVTAVVALARGRRDLRVELLAGLVSAWALITAIPHKDVRYSLPLMIFLAVLATGWIVQLRRAGRVVATSALAVAVVASTCGATLGLGSAYSGLLPGNWAAPRGQGVMRLDHFTIYASHDYMVSGPRRDGDIPGLLDGLRAAGVRNVTASLSDFSGADSHYDKSGLLVAIRLARLAPVSGSAGAPAHLATLIHRRRFGRARPCVRLDDGEGVWIRLGDATSPRTRDYCPRFRPRFYGP